MSFQPQANQELTIGDVTYEVAEHPAASGIPYGQEGRQAIVYKLVARANQRTQHALKVFKPRYRLPELVSLAKQLTPLAGLQGLQVCRRTVLAPQEHAALLRQYPDLTYAVLMPWVEGPTWMEVLGKGQALSSEESLVLARSLVEILAGMEQRRLAHCDLSGSNLILPSLVTSTGSSRISAAELVDLEQLYGPDLKRPELLPSGSQGYAHRTAVEGLWNSKADRFAGTVLLAEMLGWCDERVRKAAWGESYFAPQEMQQESDRFQTLVGALRERWGAGVGELFERAWHSAMLADCATFGEWLVTLPEEVSVVKTTQVVSLSKESQAEHPEITEDALKGLMDIGTRLEKQGNAFEALEVYRQARKMTLAISDLTEKLDSIIRNLEAGCKESATSESRPPGEEMEAEPPVVEARPAEESAPPHRSAPEEELALVEQEVEAGQGQLPTPGLELPVENKGETEAIAPDIRSGEGVGAAENHLVQSRFHVSGWVWALGGLLVLAAAVVVVTVTRSIVLRPMFSGGGSQSIVATRIVRVTATPQPIVETRVMKAEVTLTPQPTNTLIPTLTPPPPPPRPTVDAEPDLYDNFDDPSANGSFDRGKWVVGADSPHQIDQQDGVLMVTVNAETETSGVANLMARQYKDVALSTLAADTPMFVESKLMLA